MYVCHAVYYYYCARYTRNEDHVALMVEIMGNFDRSFVLTGKHRKMYFTKNGVLKPARKLRPCSLFKFLHSKFGFPHEEALVISDFLEKALQLTPAKRWTARQLLQHDWFKGTRNGDLI